MRLYAPFNVRETAPSGYPSKRSGGLPALRRQPAQAKPR